MANRTWDIEENVTMVGELSQ